MRKIAEKFNFIIMKCFVFNKYGDIFYLLKRDNIYITLEHYKQGTERSCIIHIYITNIEIDKLSKREMCLLSCQEKIKPFRDYIFINIKSTTELDNKIKNIIVELNRILNLKYLLNI